MGSRGDMRWRTRSNLQSKPSLVHTVRLFVLIVGCICRMSSLNSKYAGNRNVSGSSATSVAASTAAGANGRDKRVTKRKASAELTPSAPNGMALRPSASASMLNLNGRRKLEEVADTEDSPRVKRARVERQPSQGNIDVAGSRIGK